MPSIILESEGYVCGLKNYSDLSHQFDTVNMYVIIVTIFFDVHIDEYLLKAKSFELKYWLRKISDYYFDFEENVKPVKLSYLKELDF